MDRLIPIIGKLQDVVLNAVGSAEIDLPQIVVVGAQSTGKSSVLENIVGRDFLPRGSGIVTRRPLLLHLNNIPKTSLKEGQQLLDEEWGEFRHKPDQPFYDFFQIRKEIEAETDRLTGTNKGISPEPIILTIYSPHVLNLSLVDLPGLTETAVGDQPLDISLRLRKMALDYIRPENAIIVAVCAANVDLANSPALQLAKEVDPYGKRTIGVMTKIDLMDKGSDAKDILTGNGAIPLQLGYIGVISRSQMDIINGKPIREALKAEVEFFQNHPKYKTIASKCGTKYLATQLNTLLLRHIKSAVPKLREKVANNLRACEKELASYGSSFELGENKGSVLLDLINKFAGHYGACLDGTNESDGQARTSLVGGARISYIFSAFRDELDKIGALDGLGNDAIRIAIRNATGTRSALFVPDVAFELLAKRQIEKLREPALQCAEYVFDELQTMLLQKLESNELLQYQRLRERIQEVVEALLSEYRNPTLTMVNNLINVELAFINSAHPNFVGANLINQMTDEKIRETLIHEQQQRDREMALQLQQQQLAKSKAGQPGPSVPARSTNPFPAVPAPAASVKPTLPEKPAAAAPTKVRQQRPKEVSIALDSVPIVIKPKGPLSTEEELKNDLIKKLLESYFKIVKKNVQDAIPKAIMYTLVNRSRSNLNQKLIHELVVGRSVAQIDELLSAAPEILARFKNTKDNADKLKKALEILNEITDFSLR
jgi:replication fork clamp-binding protein CrfC